MKSKTFKVLINIKTLMLTNALRFHSIFLKGGGLKKNLRKYNFFFSFHHGPEKVKSKKN